MRVYFIVLFDYLFLYFLVMEDRLITAFLPFHCFCKTTPTQEVQAQNVEKLQSRWLEKDKKPGGGTYCDIAKAKLWSDELKESLDRLILLARCGYLTDPLSAVDMREATASCFASVAPMV